MGPDLSLTHQANNSTRQRYRPFGKGTYGIVVGHKHIIGHRVVGLLYKRRCHGIIYNLAIECHGPKSRRTP